jgi:hypothetical protein
MRTCCLFLLLLGTALSARAAPVPLPEGRELAEVDFERHVVPLLGRLGCNAGSCHGSFQGKGGLRLSLFGHAPELDYRALTRDALGRRIDRVDPDRSLLLLKPTAQVSHEGGRRMRRDSWEYRVFRQWIVQGMPWRRGSGAVRRIDIHPAEHRFDGAGETVSLRVEVEFADGTRADVTPFCEARIKHDAVAEVLPTGQVRAVRPGDTVVVVSYRGHLATARRLVPAAVPEGFAWPVIPEENFIDREVLARLRRLNMVPVGLCSDAEFLRRVSLDTIGTLPAPDEVRSFLADLRPDKRARKIEELLAHPRHAALWATRFCDITGASVDVMDGPPELRSRRAQMWHDWLRQRFAANVPYDQIVRGILCATSRDGADMAAWMQQEIALAQAAQKGFTSDYARRASLDLFWRRVSGDDFFPIEQMAELTAAAFLGVRIECAQCHKHPFDRWTQADYRAFANVFAQVQYGSSNELRAATARLLEERRRTGQGDKPLPRLREIHVSQEELRRQPDPDTRAPLPARALGGPEIPFDGDARARLLAWLVRPDNPYFARALVNRVWAHYFGSGLVDPVDSFSVANPPSNERLLDALAADFVHSGHDFRRLERLLLQSRTYQLSSVPEGRGTGNLRPFTHAPVRRLMAEVVADMLDDALGVREGVGADAPPGARAIEVATNRVRQPHLAEVFRIFGRPPRAALCDCERPREPSIPQTLFLMTDPHLLKKIASGRLKTLLASTKSDDEIIAELFLATVSRFPDEREKRAAREHVAGKKDRRAGLIDVLWALVNTRELILNH